MAISMGAVFMGAMTYIGNAPNFMVVSIVQNRGVKMPSFFGFMAWSYGILAVSYTHLHTVHMLRRANDSVRGTGIRAETAADALVGIDF